MPRVKVYTGRHVEVRDVPDTPQPVKVKSKGSDESA